MSSPSPLLPPPEEGLPLLGTATLRSLEGDAPSGELMARAGLAVARLARARWPAAQRVSVVCGPGNNGGDGLVAARHLQAWGLAVQLVEIAPTKPASPERQQALALAAGLRRSPLAELDPRADLIVDALLGIGLRAAPAGVLAVAIENMHQHPAPKLGVDLPSGLNADTGDAPGAVLRCTATLSLLAPPPGLFTGQGREQAGELWLDRLGIQRRPPPVAMTGSPRLAWLGHSPRARWPHAAHKGSAGQVWVGQGPADLAGAARMAAGAALAAGAGRVYVCGPQAQAAPDPIWPELMHPALPLPGVEGVGVLGCGGGAQVADALPEWLDRAGALVLDADALNAVAAQPALQAQLEARGRQGRRTVLTPHPLEAARLLGLPDAAAVQRDRLTHARQLAERFGCTVVLKGSGSIVATPGLLPYINSSGHAALATAGTGDVLAGWLGGLMAQAPKASLQEIASIACAWQGEAADAACPMGGGPLRATRLIEAMAALHPRPA